MGLVEGKVALVTGAASGIGRATAVAFASEGASVVVSDVDDAGGKETVGLVESEGGTAAYVHCDVSDEAEVEALVAATVETFGGLDCAHNNAGITGAVALTADRTLEDWHRTLSVDLTGVFLCLKHEIPAMLERGGGAIVNTSSVAGELGGVTLNDYVASKAGVLGLTRTAANEYAKQGIRVNAVLPGAVRTPMIEQWISGNETVEKMIVGGHPIGRMADPSEIAEAVVWLCSDRASYVVGVGLPVDGGALIT